MKKVIKSLFFYVILIQVSSKQFTQILDEIKHEDFSSIPQDEELLKEKLKEIIKEFENFTQSEEFKNIQNLPLNKDFDEVKKWVEGLGYQFEEYQYPTKDGYLNTAWRIPGKLGQEKPNPKPLILYHGLLDCSWTFFQQPNTTESLAFYFVDRGYDAWFPNNRGDTLSYNHTTLNSSDLNGKYWDFSIEDFAEYDIPAIIDFVKSKTHVDKVDYLGHSQGTTTFLMNYMTNPEYLSKNIDHFVALGFVPNIKYTRNPFLKILDELKDFLSAIIKIEAILVFPPKTHEFLYKFATAFPDIYKIVIEAVFGNYPSGFIDYTKIAKWLLYTPGGTSKKNCLHWAQVYETKKLSKYDYGPVKNLEVYGQLTPPEYNTEILRDWDIKIFFPYVDNDSFGSYEDEKEFFNLVKDKSLIKTIDLLRYNHIDVLSAYKATKEIYPKIYQFLLNKL